MPIHIRRNEHAYCRICIDFGQMRLFAAFLFNSIWYQEVLYSIVYVSMIEKCVYHFIFELESLLSHSVNITRHFSRKSVDDCNTTNRCEQEHTNIWKKEEKRNRNNKSKSTRTQFNFSLSRSELVFLVISLNFVIFIIFFFCFGVK